MNTNEAVDFLKKADPILDKIIHEAGDFTIELQSDYFISLVRAIVFQQLSGKAAGTIFSRFEELLDFKITPKNCSQLSPTEYRSVGISKQKCSYILDLSHHFLNDPNGFAQLDQFSNEDIIKKLVSVKGIGVWTAQMFLMFTLLRLDIFPTDDLGIKNALIKFYGVSEKPKKEEMEIVAEKWKPYRTIASWYLWRSLDG